MQIDVLKRIVHDQKKEIDEKQKREHIIAREGVQEAKLFLQYPNVLAVLGVRRAGKSIFSRLVANTEKNNFGYINFDDERLFNIKTEDLDDVLKVFYELYGDIEVIILDEIQNVPGWELFVTRLRDTKKIIITGSNSNLLSGELATHLTGRHIDTTIYPFSFHEFLNFLQIKPDITTTRGEAEIRNNLEKYIHGSGFPEYGKFGSSIIVQIYEDIITKDCLRRYNLKNKTTFKELANYLISNFSNAFTYNKLAHIFNIKDPHTVKNYVRYLNEAFVIIVLDKYAQKLKQQHISPKKVYVIDQGFCNFLSYSVSKNIGKLFENIVCLQLLRRLKNKHGKIYYWKSTLHEEVDFVVRENEKVIELIQVCYELNILNKERELKSLVKASKELDCTNLIVITNDKPREETYEGKRIKFVPLWSWLLEEE